LPVWFLSCRLTETPELNACHHIFATQVHTLQLTSKKLEAYRRETEQLFYSMSGAEIFFKRTDIDT
jgi:hypothetical protein